MPPDANYDNALTEVPFDDEVGSRLTGTIEKFVAASRQLVEIGVLPAEEAWSTAFQTKWKIFAAMDEVIAAAEENLRKERAMSK